MTTFLKNQWNIIASISIAIVAMLNRFVVPPNIDLYTAEGSVDYTAFSRFIVAAIILLLIFPFSHFKAKKHAFVWWGISLASLALALFCYTGYIEFTERKTGYNDYSSTRVVMGDKLDYLAQKAIDSVRKATGVNNITPDKIVEQLGQPKEYFPKDEIIINSRILIRKYVATILFFSLFIVCSIQVLYCSTAAQNQLINPPNINHDLRT